MGNENFQADIIYEFWRWEYLRRNEEYKEQYNIFATYLNSLGITGFKYTGSYDEPWLENIFETDGREFPSEHSLNIFMLLFKMIDEFKVFPPLNPDINGISSEKLLRDLAEQELIGKKDLIAFYQKLPKANYQPLPLSTIIQIDTPHKNLPKSISDRHTEFLRQNPIIQSLDAITHMTLNKFLENFKIDGKYEIIAKAPKKIIIKDKKICLAMEKSLKTLTSALRNKKKEFLKMRGKRIKTLNLTRAIGLYLWDGKKERGHPTLGIVLSCQKIVDDVASIYPFPFPSNKEIYTLVRQTDQCIENRDVLPLYPPNPAKNKL